jgi:uncharacterized repeat protein (TIGR02543 family)
VRFVSRFCVLILIFAAFATCSNPSGGGGGSTTYTVTFDSHGGSDVDAITAGEGATVTKPATDPVQNGYTFTGWFSAASGGALYAWPHALIADVTMHAQWRDNSQTPPAQYTITFESHSGSAVPSISADEGTTVTMPADPTKEGFTLNGWYSEASGGTLYTWPHALIADVTMHAQWRDNSLPPPTHYTITCDSHGGSAVEPIIADEGTAITRPADPAQDGYTFNGWYSEASGGTEYTWPHTLSADIIMHAQWTPIPTYTITFESHGGSAVGTITQNEGTQAAKPEDPVQGIFMFNGWFDEESGGTEYTWPHTLSANVTMHAQWTPVYAVIFHPVGGSPVPEQQTVMEGGKASVPATMTRTAEGLYTGTVANVDTLTVIFQGWYTNPAYTGSVWNFNNDTVTNSLNLYAKWSAPVVDLDSQSGDNVLAKALNYIKNNPPAVTTNYTIVLDGNYAIDGGAVNINTANAVITLLGKVPSEVSLSSNGYLFQISAGELILDNNITLKGLTTNNSPLIRVYGASASLTMKAGAKITGNTAAIGGGVYVSGGRLTMEGGEISGNTATISGGCVGVYVYNGSFTMSGGKISDNTATIGGGGGVSVSDNSSFIMSGGEISGNTSGFGGGVIVQNSSFNKTGNSIICGDIDGDPDNGNATDNTATQGNKSGHAVYYQAYDDNAKSWIFYYRDATLGSGVNISTATLPTEAGPSNSVGNWIKK